MSINLHLVARLKAHTKLGPKIITERCDLIETPTEVTDRIMRSRNRKDAYFKWVLERCKPYEQDVYAEDDIFRRREPIGKRIVYPFQENIKEVKAFLKEHKGWRIEWYGM